MKVKTGERAEVIAEGERADSKWTGDEMEVKQGKDENRKAVRKIS